MLQWDSMHIFINRKGLSILEATTATFILAVVILGSVNMMKKFVFDINIAQGLDEIEHAYNNISYLFSGSQYCPFKGEEIQSSASLEYEKPPSDKGESSYTQKEKKAAKVFSQMELVDTEFSKIKKLELNLIPSRVTGQKIDLEDERQKYKVKKDKDEREGVRIEDRIFRYGTYFNLKILFETKNIKNEIIEVVKDLKLHLQTESEDYRRSGGHLVTSCSVNALFCDAQAVDVLAQYEDSAGTKRSCYRGRRVEYNRIQTRFLGLGEAFSTNYIIPSNDYRRDGCFCSSSFHCYEGFLSEMTNCFFRRGTR